MRERGTRRRMRTGIEFWRCGTVNDNLAGFVDVDTAPFTKEVFLEFEGTQEL